MRKIRSIQVVNVRWFNATAWYGMYLAKLLRAAGHESMLIALPDTKACKKAEEWALEPVSLPMNAKNPVDLAVLYGVLGKLVDDFKPDVVNCHRGEAFALWAMLKKRGKFALVRTRGDQRPPKNNFINRCLHKSAADAIIATNSATARAFTQDLGIPPQKLFTILGGVDTARFYPNKAAGAALRSALGIAPDEFVLGILGRLDPVKGHELLIKAVGEAQKARPEKKLRLICIGADSSIKKAELEAAAQACGLGTKAHITGLVDDVPAYINALDLGVLASVGSETIARAALEIMACEVPLLSSHVGVMPDLLPPELLVKINSVSDLGAGILKCLDDPDYLPILAQAGRTAIEGLAPEDFLQKTLAVYEYALNKAISA